VILLNRLMAKTQIKQMLLVAVLTGVCLAGFNILGPSAVHAGPTSPQDKVTQCTKSDFFGLEPWYQYIGTELNSDGSCEVKCFNIFDQGHNVGEPTNHCGQSKSDIPLILVAVIDDLLRIAGLTSLAFVIYGAFEYVGSQGNSEVTAKAQSMVINALIGLAVATVAVVVVNFIGNNIGT
jgi:hypothetical protein